MKLRPTFEMLCEQGALRVMYPATRCRFTISLRGWQGALWAVKVIPDAPRMADAYNPFIQKHRMLSRPSIEDWLARLRVTRKPGKVPNRCGAGRLTK